MSRPETALTSDIARRWERRVQRVATAKREVSRIECELLNAQNELGRRMDPGDMKVGEIVHLWVRLDKNREVLLACRKEDDSGNGTYSVAPRGELPPPAVRMEVPQ